MRREITSRPVLVWLVGFCLGLCDLRTIWPLILLLPFCWFIDKWSSRAGLVVAFLVGTIWIPHPPSVPFSPYSASTRFEAITLATNRLDGSRFLARTNGILIQARSKDFLSVVPGEIYDSVGTIKPLDPIREGYLAQQGVQGVFEFYGQQAVMIRTAPVWQSIPAGIQRYFIRITNYIYGKSNGSWISAFCFNEEGSLDNDSVQVLRRSGTYHLISASGLHIGVLALFLQFLLGLLRVKRGWMLPVIGFVLLFYSIMTGFHDATVRACVMWAIGFGHYLLRREQDALTSLSVAGLGWLLYQPSSLFLPAFQLSYIVTAGLIMFGGSFEEMGLRSRAIQALRVSVVATLGSEPLIAWWFGQITVVSIAANLSVAFAASALLILGLLSVLVASVNIAVGEWVAQNLAVPILGWIQASIDFASRQDFAMYRIDRFPSAFLFLYFAGWLLVWKPPLRKKPRTDLAGK